MIAATVAPADVARVGARQPSTAPLDGHHLPVRTAAEAAARKAQQAREAAQAAQKAADQKDATAAQKTAAAAAQAQADAQRKAAANDIAQNSQLADLKAGRDPKGNPSATTVRAQADYDADSPDQIRADMEYDSEMADGQAQVAAAQAQVDKLSAQAKAADAAATAPPVPYAPGYQPASSTSLFTRPASGTGMGTGTIADAGDPVHWL
jgi:hypothetical protein